MIDRNDDKNDVVTFTAADGSTVDFIEIAGINLDGHFYAILKPVVPLPGMSEDEALVFEGKNVDGQSQFNIVVDSDVIDAVFDEYERLLAEND